MYLYDYSITVDVLSVLKEGNAVTVPIATAAHFLDL